MSQALRYRLELALEERRRASGAAAALRSWAAVAVRRVARLEAWEALVEATGRCPGDDALTCAACVGSGVALTGDGPCAACEGTGVATAPAAVLS